MSNPALVLYAHFQQLSQFDQNTSSWPDAWQSVLGGQPYLEAVGPLCTLIDQTREILAARAEAIDLNAVLMHEEEWRRAVTLIGVNPAAAMNQVPLISPASLSSLYLVGQIINGYPETRPGIRNEQIERLAEAVAALRQEALNADDVEPDVRQYLLNLATKMQARIDQVRVMGTGPIEDLIEETIGSSAANSGKLARISNTTLKQKLISVYIAFNAIVGAVDTTAAGIESAASHAQGAVTAIEHIFGEGPKAIEGPKDPPALPPGNGSDH